MGLWHRLTWAPLPCGCAQLLPRRQGEFVAISARLAVRFFRNEVVPLLLKACHGRARGMPLPAQGCC